MDVLFTPTYSENIDAECYANWVQESLRMAADGARENLKTAKQHQKLQYDRHATRVPGYKVGDLVWYKNRTLGPGKSAKLARPWEGPYVVTLVPGRLNVKIRNPASPGRALVVHVNDVKPCRKDVRLNSEDKQTRKVTFNLRPEVRTFTPDSHLVSPPDENTAEPSVQIDEHDLYSDDSSDSSDDMDLGEVIDVHDPMLDSDFDSDDCLLLQDMSADEGEDADPLPRVFGRGPIPSALLEDWRKPLTEHVLRGTPLPLSYRLVYPGADSWLTEIAGRVARSCLQYFRNREHASSENRRVTPEQIIHAAGRFLDWTDIHSHLRQHAERWRREFGELQERLERASCPPTARSAPATPVSAQAPRQAQVVPPPASTAQPVSSERQQQPPTRTQAAPAVSAAAGIQDHIAAITEAVTRQVLQALRPQLAQATVPVNTISAGNDENRDPGRGRRRNDGHPAARRIRRRMERGSASGARPLQHRNERLYSEAAQQPNRLRQQRSNPRSEIRPTGRPLPRDRSRSQQGGERRLGRPLPQLRNDTRQPEASRRGHGRPESASSRSRPSRKVVLVGDSNFVGSPFNTSSFHSVARRGMRVGEAAAAIQHDRADPRDVAAVLVGVGVNDRNAPTIDGVRRGFRRLNDTIKAVYPEAPVFFINTPATKFTDAETRSHLHAINNIGACFFETIPFEPTRQGTQNPHYTAEERRALIRVCERTMAADNPFLPRLC